MTLRPATIKDGELILPLLRVEDQEEVKGTGMSLSSIPRALEYSEHASYLEAPDGDPMAIGGVVRTSEDVGQIWLLSTPKILTHPKHFIKTGLDWFNAIQDEYTILWNYTDCRNTVHHRFLKHWGFRAIRLVSMTTTGLPYYEIVKLCAPQ